MGRLVKMFFQTFTRRASDTFLVPYDFKFASQDSHLGAFPSVGPQAEQHSCQVRLHAKDSGLWPGSDGCHGPPHDTLCGYALLQGA